MGMRTWGVGGSTCRCVGGGAEGVEVTKCVCPTVWLGVSAHVFVCQGMRGIN